MKELVLIFIGLVGYAWLSRKNRAGSDKGPTAETDPIALHGARLDLTDRVCQKDVHTICSESKLGEVGYEG